MINNLCIFLSNLRNDTRIKLFDEAATKQAIIIRMLQLLGWDVFNIDEVYPEFSIENKRVDYALRINNSNEFFLEVKRPSEDLDRHQEQLLEYAFRLGVELAALTNGITWLFYLPTKKGDWSSRRFYAIDIFEQDPKEASEKFVQILSMRERGRP
ncbi:MAG: type I restriction enzyme HsdR N-terminal domain-containing protein [Desulfobacterales bacterium]|nr:type I restriction enzyme HsdR N-terminal domain-containing protein [Desulfobacterales bacterium]